MSSAKVASLESMPPDLIGCCVQFLRLGEVACLCLTHSSLRNSMDRFPPSAWRGLFFSPFLRSRLRHYDDQDEEAEESGRKRQGDSPPSCLRLGVAQGQGPSNANFRTHAPRDCTFRHLALIAKLETERKSPGCRIQKYLRWLVDLQDPSHEGVLKCILGCSMLPDKLEEALFRAPKDFHLTKKALDALEVMFDGARQLNPSAVFPIRSVQNRGELSPIDVQRYLRVLEWVCLSQAHFRLLFAELGQLIMRDFGPHTASQASSWRVQPVGAVQERLVQRVGPGPVGTVEAREEEPLTRREVEEVWGRAAGALRGLCVMAGGWTEMDGDYRLWA